MTGDEFDVRSGLGDRHPELVEAVARGEYGKAGGERDLAAGGESRGHSDHVLLSDTDREEALGKLLAELDGGGGDAEVGVDANNVETFVSQAG